MALFAWLSRRGKEISTPRKIAIGMFIAGLAFLFLVIYSALKGLSLIHICFHNYGMAVDLSILGSDGVALDMGSPYDFFGEEAHTVDDDYLLKTGRISEAAYHNRRFLYAVMREQELYPLPNEWWHYQHYVQESDKKRFKILDF